MLMLRINVTNRRKVGTNEIMKQVDNRNASSQEVFVHILFEHLPVLSIASPIVKGIAFPGEKGLIRMVQTISFRLTFKK